MSGFDFSGTAIEGPDDFEHFGCKVFRKNPDTPDWLTRSPDTGETAKTFTRKAFNSGELTAWDGKRVRYWGFADPQDRVNRKPFPSPAIRVREGDLVHSTVEASFGSHTIHHHGLEPTSFNDGVGHVSFEVTGRYTYQLVPRQAGTYIYHCHKNTVLHAEMGMVGLFIVDPRPLSDERSGGYRGRGFKRAYSGFMGVLDPQYEIEALWVLDDIDPVWHELNHDAGLCGEDVGLNDFNPRYFFLTGVGSDPRRDFFVRASTAVRQGPVTTFTGPVTAQWGQRVLLRIVPACYAVLRATFAGLNPLVISVDGHALGTRDRPWSRPFWLIAGDPSPTAAASSLRLTAANRHDLYIDTRQLSRGRYDVTFEFLHWITLRRFTNGIVRTSITVV